MWRTLVGSMVCYKFSAISRAKRGEASMQPWKLGAIAIVAAPFVLFVLLLVIDPPAAGTFAGTLLARLTDQPIVIGIVASCIFGAVGYRWPWALGVGVIAALVGCAIGFSWWQKIAGSDLAIRTAMSFAIWTILLAAYGYIAGRLFHGDKTRRAE